MRLTLCLKKIQLINKLHWENIPRGIDFGRELTFGQNKPEKVITSATCCCFAAGLQWRLPCQCIASRVAVGKAQRELRADGADGQIDIRPRPLAEACLPQPKAVLPIPGAALGARLSHQHLNYTI